MNFLDPYTELAFQWKMTQVFWPLPHTWQTGKFLAPGFSLAIVTTWEVDKCIQGPKHMDHLGLRSLTHYQGAGLGVEQKGLEPVSTLNASIMGSSFT